MKTDDEREQLRQVYQREEIGEKTFIPAKPKIDIYGADRVFRVCAYCRVSTENDAQLSSFELQQSHYKQLVGTHPNWILKHIYADEGISGTSLKNRDDFNRMIAACEAGEYDLIVTKSVSRFARNLVDCISLVRKLKRQTPPVGVYFETDNLNTLSEDSELMLSFLATFAQEESVKKSESMNWSLKQRFKDGKLLTPAPLGYDRPKDVTGRYIKYARLEINEAEAKIVRFIFDAYLAGKSMKEIAALLTDIGVETKVGGIEWNEGSIGYILRNERYCGNVLTWKTFTADMYEHRHKKNNHDRDQYLYTRHHDGIVSVETFEAVQVMLASRKHRYSGGLPTVQVVDDGVFRGYVPINHHWINDDPGIYYDASNSVAEKGSMKRIRRRMFSAFDFEGYQVVRGQFFTNRPDCPCITVGGNKIVFNTFCIRKFISVGYIQLLLHPTERKIAIRPCEKKDAHSIRWRPDADKPAVPKAISCQHFVAALYQIMEWNPDYFYHVRGSWASRGRDEIIVFSLANAMPSAVIETEEARSRREKLLPQEWSESFGDEFYEYALDNSFYFLAPRTDWKAQEKSVLAPGVEQPDVPTDAELAESIEKLKSEVDT